MNSGLPGSPTRRGPPRQAYQYVFVVPSASVATDQCNPLTLISLLLTQPILDFGVRGAPPDERLANDHGNFPGRGVEIDPLSTRALGRAHGTGKLTLAEPVLGARMTLACLRGMAEFPSVIASNILWLLIHFSQ